jgi:hypothetical protein
LSTIPYLTKKTQNQDIKMIKTRRSTLGFIFGSAALAAGIVSQILLSTGFVLWALVLFALAIGIFVLFFATSPARAWY